MACVNNVSAFFDSMNSMSVKELDRIKKHIEKLIESKRTDDRKFIGSLDINDYVSYCPNYLSEIDVSEIHKDLESCQDFANCENGTKSMWLSTTGLSYKWSSYSSGKSTLKEANPMKKFVSVSSLLEKINASMGTSLNSCLIQYYPNGASGIRLHDDFEWELDHSQPFVNISIGGYRKVEFFSNYQRSTERPAKVIFAENGSMYTMNKECQKYFRHRVPTDGNNTEPRFNLSFRCILDLKNAPLSLNGPDSWRTPIKPVLLRSRASASPRSLPAVPRSKVMSPSSPHAAVPSAPQREDSPSPPPASPSAPLIETSPALLPAVASAPLAETSPALPPAVPSAPLAEISPISTPAFPSAPELDTSPGTSPVISSVYQQPHQTVDRRDITVLFGTSMTSHLDCNFISNKDTEFVNVSVSGARLKNPRWANKIPDIATMVRDFAESQPDKVARVKSVVYSCGTNDIKYLRSKQLGPLYRHLCELVTLTRRLFGHRVKINFQSVLPMRVMYNYTADNFLNFNRLLQNVCYSYGCNYIDFFRHFLDLEGNDINLMLYADPIHLNRRGVSYFNRLMLEFTRNGDFDSFCAFY